MNGAGESHRVLLVLVDLRGFSRFTRASRTASIHGRGILAELVARLRAAVGGPLRTVKQEEDGLFLVVDLEGLDAPGDLQGLHGHLAGLVTSFEARQRELMAANTCPCEACLAVPKIRLKVLAHTGSVLLRHPKRGLEVTGADVNLAYRLRDNDLHAASHVLLTHAAWQLLGPSEGFDPVELGPVPGDAGSGYLRALEPRDGLPTVSGWVRFGLMLRKATWEFRFLRQGPQG